MGNPAAVITNFFQRHGSPVAPYGNFFVKAGNRYGVDPRLIAAIVMKETEGGKTGTGRPGQFNLTGVGGVGNMHSYPNYQASIMDTAKNLGSSRYKGKSLATQTAMWVAGTPPTASTAGYTRDVSGFLKMLGGPSVGSAPGGARIPRPPTYKPQPLSSVGGGGNNLGFLGKMIGQISGVPALGSILQSLGGKGAGAHKLPQQQIASVGPHQIPVVKEGYGPTTHTEAKAVNMIHQYLGRPYVYGGRTPQQGFDCSGLVQWVYSRLGVKLGNTTYDQIKQGKPVQYNNLRPGDIVFFYGPNPHHEGLYIGGGKFIHAPHTGDVIKISDLHSGHYKDNFAAARRVA